MARYSGVAITLHWAIALALIANFVIGLIMPYMMETPEMETAGIQAYQIHKSIGLTVLALSLVRLLWRLLYPPPPLPEELVRWEKITASLTHWMFYILMVGIPLTGWLYVSLQWRDSAPLHVPTLWFGLFEIPHLFGLDQQSAEVRQSLSGDLHEAHEILAFGAMILLVLHVGAVFKHQIFDRSGVLNRMFPAEGHYQRPLSRHPVRLMAAAVIVLCLATLAWWILQGQSGSTDRISDSPIGITSEGWKIVPAESYIRFHGQHAGNPFTGRFERWHAVLNLDPGNPARSSIHVTVHTASARDGSRLHEKSLPQREWFHTGKYPTATYTSNTVSASGEDSYLISGTLNIKNNRSDVPHLRLKFNGEQATISGTVTIDRADIDMGMESDPQGQWVSRDISVEVRAVAQPG